MILWWLAKVPQLLVFGAYIVVWGTWEDKSCWNWNMPT